MELTRDSLALIKSFSQNLQANPPCNSTQHAKGIDDIAKVLGRRIAVAKKNVEKRWQSGEISVRYISRTIGLKTVGPPMESYIPLPKVRNYIRTCLQGCWIYATTINRRTVQLFFGILCDLDHNRKGYFDRVAKNMLVWLEMSQGSGPSTCAKQLSVYSFFTPFKKILPRDTYVVLGPEHCNSASTTSCTPTGTVVIYRKEEHFKVFLHETFHILGLDHSGPRNDALVTRMKRLFPISSKFRIYEAYAETWACFLNSLFCAEELAMLEREDLELYQKECRSLEQEFALFQAGKVLDFMGLDYPQLYGEDQASWTARRYLFKEETEVFAYYIIKALLLHRAADFFRWCRRGGGDIFSLAGGRKNLAKLVDFIEKHHRDKAFITALRSVGPRLTCLDPQTEDHLINTTRMSICEMDLANCPTSTQVKNQ